MKNKQQYNLLIITPDQLRADYLSCYGHKSVGTQHIDRLANEGVKFDKAYCAAPLCGPSRISLVTSTYLSEHNHRNYWSTIDPKVPNVVSSLKQAGYKTGMFGKNHCFTYSKLKDVWDELDEICLGNYDDHPDYKRSFDSFPLAEDHHYNITERLTDETIEFMSNADQPFLAWVNYQDPHPAFTCPEPYYSMFNPDDVDLPKSFREYDKSKEPVRNEVWRIHSEMDQCSDEDMRRAIATYMGQIRYVDDNVGRMLKSLEENGQLDNTVILFFGDHGELLGHHGMTHKGPMFYESLARIPVIIRHPEGRWAGTDFTGLFEEVDIVPTVLETLGVDIPPTMVGRSFKRPLDEGDVTGRETALCEAGGGAPTCKEPIPGFTIKAPHAPTSFGPGSMLRKGSWKLSIYFDDMCELYDLDDDPEEIINRYEDPDCRELRDSMTLELLKRVQSVKVRDIGGDGLDWPADQYPIDVRFETLEAGGSVVDDHE